MAQQVSGSELSLINAIREGIVPQPVLQGWNEWQVWRRENGRRPLVRTDGYTTSAPQEAALWRSAMTELYGNDWTEQLINPSVVDEEPVTGSDAGQEGKLGTQPASSAPAPIPNTSAPATQFQTPPPTARVRLSIPGSGDVYPVPELTARTGAASPGSGVVSTDSWDSGSPGTPSGITARISRGF